MFKTTTHPKAGTLARRQKLVWVALFSLSALALRPAAADTYLSRWENATRCNFVVTGNGEAKVIPANSTFDFGPFPAKDPQGIEVTPTGSCDAKLKKATIDWRGSMGNDPHWRCPGADHGPYRFIVNNGSGDIDFCYCIKTLLVGYVGVVIAPDEVTLRYSASTYKCQRR